MSESETAVLNGPASETGELAQSTKPATTSVAGMVVTVKSGDTGSKTSVALEAPPVVEAKKATLVELETKIQGPLEGTWKKGGVFKEIDSRKLYLDAGYKTFEKYCEKRWGLTYRYVKQCMDSFDVRKALSEYVSAGEFSLPLHEGQIRPLTALKTAEKQSEAWNKAWAKAKGQPTGELVAAIVKKLLNKPPAPFVRKVGQWLSDLKRMQNEVPEVKKIAPGLAAALKKLLGEVNKVKKTLDAKAKAEAKVAAKAKAVAKAKAAAEAKAATGTTTKTRKVPRAAKTANKKVRR